MQCSSSVAAGAARPSSNSRRSFARVKRRSGRRDAWRSSRWRCTDDGARRRRRRFRGSARRPRQTLQGAPQGIVSGCKADEQRLCGYAGIRVGEAQHPGPPCMFILQGVRDAKLPCIACPESVRRGYVVHTCQRCGCVCCHRCGPVRRDCIVAEASTPDYVAAGLQDSRTAATLKLDDFQGGRRGSTPGRSQSHMQNGHSTPGFAVQATQVSAIDWGGDNGNAHMEQEEATSQQPQRRLTCMPAKRMACMLQSHRHREQCCRWK